MHKGRGVRTGSSKTRLGIHHVTEQVDDGFAMIECGSRHLVALGPFGDVDLAAFFRFFSKSKQGVDRFKSLALI